MPSEADRILVELALKNHLIQPPEGDAALAESTPSKDAGAILLAKGLIQQRHLDSLKKKVEKQLAERPASQGDKTQVHMGGTETGGQPTGALPPSAIYASDPSGATQVTAAAEPARPQPSTAIPASLDPQRAGLILFGQIAVQARLINNDDLQGALARQSELEKLGVKRRLGEILVDRKKLTLEQVQKVLTFQEKFIYGCPQCGGRWNVSGSALQAQLKCPTCNATLQPASSIQSVGVQGTVGMRSPSSVQPMPRPTSSLQHSQLSQSSGGRNPPTPEDPAGLLGLTWRGYKIDKVLGKGGMGAVYLATQLSLNRKVALKVMLRGAQAKSEELARFVREARKALAQLSHPYILKAWDAELEANGELAWFTMEFVKGRSFKEALSSGTFPMDKGARTVAKLARAMDYSHKKGIIHRDLKPQNVMLDEEDTPKILDFGLAKTIDQNTMQQLTQVGAFLGTPSYMAPEQAGGDPNLTDGRADVYALGAILYEVLTGQPPFRASNPVTVIKKVLQEPPVPPTKVFPQTLAVLEPCCLKALEKDPAKRQQTAAELADEIEAALGPETPTQTASAPAADKKDDAPKKSIFGRLFGG